MTHKKVRISVEVQRGNVEKALRILKKKVNAEGIIRDLKKNNITKSHLISAEDSEPKVLLELRNETKNYMKNG